MEAVIKIIITEDQTILRKALISCLKKVDGFEVIAEAANGKQLVDLLKQQSPDIVLLDLKMPVMDGWEALEVIKVRFPKTKVIVLSNNDGIETISKTAAKGATGFVSKNDDVDELILAIKDVYCVGKYYSDTLTRALANYSNNNAQEEESTAMLSKRETEIVKEVCNGLSNTMISKKLFISSSTVDFHKQRIYKKTNSKNVLDLFRFALKNKVVSLDLIH